MIAISQRNKDSDFDRQQAKAAIEKRIYENVEAFNSGDGVGFADIFHSSYYNDEKRTAVVKNVSAMHQFYNVDYKITVDAVIVDQSMAYESGSYITTLVPKSGGETIIEEYKFLDVWEIDVDGKWRISKAMKVKVEPAPKINNREKIADNLKVYLGEYESQGKIITVGAGDSGMLIIVFPGQPSYELIEQEELVFSFKGVPNISVRFVKGEKGIKELVLDQPSGGFTAIKKI